MAEYEILTRLRNGGKRPLEVGDVVDLDETEGRRLVAIGALRPMAGKQLEVGSEPVATAQRVAAAGATGDEKPTFITAVAKMRADLDKLTVKKLDALAESSKIELDASANKAAKIETIVAAQAGQMLGILDRAELLEVSADAGFSDLAALDLTDEATDSDIRDALLRVAAAKAD